MNVQSYTEKIIALLRIKSCSKINLVLYNVWAGFFNLDFSCGLQKLFDLWYEVLTEVSNPDHEQSLATNIQRNKISKECIFL